MKKYLSAAMAAVIAATSMVAFTGDADARRRDRHYDRHYYGYNYGYRRHHHNHNDELAAGIVGFALGAIVAGTANNYARRNYYYSRNPGWDHVRRCEATYRSYDRYSDTFIGYDGRRYYCTL